ncbi:VOC family protein, partial [bacterium]
MQTRIEHIAIWVKDLERMKTFYETYFGCASNQKYVNISKGFSSYFLTFDSGARLELMCHPKINQIFDEFEPLGLSHFAISVGSQKEVDGLTLRLKTDGIPIVSEPRITGDGYYESVILDPEGNT